MLPDRLCDQQTLAASDDPNQAKDNAAFGAEVGAELIQELEKLGRVYRASGTLHGDIKPANIMHSVSRDSFRPSGQEFQECIPDYGFSFEATQKPVAQKPMAYLPPAYDKSEYSSKGEHASLERLIRQSETRYLNSLIVLDPSSPHKS